MIDKEFTQIPILDEILELVREIFPKEIKYITILQESCGWEQYTLDVDFYDKDWNLIDMPIDDFTDMEQEKFDEVCLTDFIHNSLIGMSSFEFRSPYFNFNTNHKYTYKVC
jgi:hypothetical protein